MASPMMRPRHRKVKHGIYRKIHFDFHRYMICLSILACTLSTLFLSWGAIQLEAQGNRSYEKLTNSGTDVTCFVTRSNNMTKACQRLITHELHKFVVYYGIRADCLLSWPVLMISFYFFLQESLGYVLLRCAQCLAFSKTLSIVSVLICVLVDDPSFMRETFEKAQFGSYESRLLYSFTMIILSSCFNIGLFFLIVLAFYLPDTKFPKYRVGPPAIEEVRRYEYSVTKDGETKKIHPARVSVVKATPIEDIIPPKEEKASIKSLPL
uniref:Uncharacterized protein n=1 Tax=Caenorhabditis tropicalis TaxID=1561998 RepID=A0A1I7TWF8_9PELO